MQKNKFFIGVDVSKNTLDIFSSQHQKHLKIDNNATGFKTFSKWCLELQINTPDVFVVLEFTGGYEHRFLQFCQTKKITYCRLPGMAIKRSIGIVRGKSDKVDAQRIAQFAEEKHKTIAPSKPLNDSIIRLKELLRYRKRLVRENSGYKATISEREHMFGRSKSDVISKSLIKKIKLNQAEILTIEAEIRSLIHQNEAYKLNFELLTSIRGIGEVNAWMTIAYTENFTSFDDPRKYAVYVGVVPFDHRSGTSIKGKSRVSHLANKELKQELTQGAKSAIQWDPEMRKYAQRKLENKHYMVVLNNVKFKLILRMFAVVKKQTKYVDNYTKAA
jgi:transposase